MKVRWNSTYLMLLSFQNYSEVIFSFYSKRMNDEDYHITDYDWNVAFKFMDFLKVFYDATLAYSTIYEPTSYRVLMHLYNMSYTLRLLERILCLKIFVMPWRTNSKNIGKIFPTYLFLQQCWILQSRKLLQNF